METKACQNCHTNFEIAPEDFVFYEKMKVPPPTFCSRCRLQRRLSWANLRSLYQRKMPDGKTAISMYAQDKPYNIIPDKDWWSADHDLTKYGQGYDFNRSFFEQFDGLMKQVPLPHLQRNFSTFENSDYCNAASYLKNCYLVMAADNSENVSYSYSVEEVKDSLDLLFTNKSELCYECINVKRSYRCFFCKDIEDCNELIFSEDCVGCNNCFGCFGLRNKSFQIFNKQYSKEEYATRLKELNIKSFVNCENLKQEAQKNFLSRPHQFMRGRNNDNVSGDYIYQSKNVHDSFIVEQGENCRFCETLRYFNGGTKDAYDYSIFGCNAELVYESVWCGLGVSNVRFSIWNYGSTDLQYCFGCHSSQELFGCIGLRKKKFCILNKQYSQEEYNDLVPKIIEQMKTHPHKDSANRIYSYGEFFPVELSPFDYNETLSQDFLPLTVKESEKAGYGWHEMSARTAKPDVSWKDLPDTIAEVKDDLVGRLILCKAFDEDENKAVAHNCTKVFKIIAQDLAFYRRMGLPLPRCCPNSRHAFRVGTLSMKNYSRKCVCQQTGHEHNGTCAIQFITNYSPDRPEIVYCEKCYQAEVV
ncbi:hypothetical protein HY224_02885 [Candidatus Uhrbacteria bacterium]|nr:hypothetical protein [Candidatus Uhrbacteria bacterium]